MIWTAFIAVLLPMFSCSAEARLPSQQTSPSRSEPVFVVFIDMTGSLSETQQQSIDSAIQRLCQILPPGTHLSVFPLGGYVERAGFLLKADLPDDTFATGRNQLKKMRRELPQQIAQRVKEFRQKITDREFLRHTCVSEALQFAAQIISPASAEQPPAEIVFFSDMLEDCQVSIIGDRLLLEKNDIRSELDRMRRISKSRVLVDLAGARVTAVLPTTGPTPTKTAQPTNMQLREFWRGVLSHCHTDDANYSLNPELPGRWKASARAESRHDQ